MDRGFLSNISQSGREGKIDADFNDVRRLQIMTDKLKQLIHLLELNLEVCRRLNIFYNRIASASAPETARSFRQYETMMENATFKLETHALQLKTMVSRAGGVTSMVCTLKKQRDMPLLTCDLI